MSWAKALVNRPLRRSKGNRPPYLARPTPLSEFPLKEIRLARNKFEPARCGYSGQTSTGNNRDSDNGCDNNDCRHTDSTADNRIDNKVWRNIGTDNCNHKGYTRNSPDR